MARPAVAVVGGGLAGLSAAAALAGAGCEVEVYERSRLLGGRATSFTVGAHEVDNGQHVFLGCCSAFIAFVEGLGMGGALRMQRRFDALVVRRGGAASRLRAAGLPAPWHLLTSFAAYAHLSVGGKLRIARALLRAQRTANVQDARGAESRRTFAAWLGACGQDEETLRAFWRPFFVPALNAQLDEVDAAQGLFVLRTAFFGRPEAARFGFSTVPLARIAERAAQRLAAVHRSTPVLQLDLSPDGSDVRGVVTARGAQAYDAVVLALTPPQLAHLVGGAERIGVAALDAYRASPIVDVHLWHDGGALGIEFAALLDSPVQWIFEKDAGYLCCSMSAAEAYALRGTQELVELCWDELGAALPGLAGARLVESAVTRSMDATFTPPPGGAPAGNATAIRNLALAGSWTNTGWPDTMESAVRSGRAAADHLLERQGVGGCTATTH